MEERRIKRRKLIKPKCYELESQIGDKRINVIKCEYL